MDNTDWKIGEQEAEKFFYLSNEKATEGFIKELRKLSRNEEHKIRLRKVSSHEVRVRVPILIPGNYNEKEIRILNIINKLAN